MADAHAPPSWKTVLSDSRVYPVYVSLGSSVYFALHALGTSLVQSKLKSEDDAPEPVSRLRKTIVVYKSLRLAACLVFLAAAVDGLTRWNGWHSKDVLIPVASVLTAVYCSALAAANTITSSTNQKLIPLNLTFILASAFIVYVVRDLWPLATYNDTPVDDMSHWRTPAILISTFVGAIFVPLFIPAIYVPVDPKNPMAEPHPEQEASLWSYVTYSYVSRVIRLANRIPHLSADQLPPLADYDQGYYLRKIGLSELDPLEAGKGRYLLWGLTRVFAWPIFLSAFYICLVGVAEVMTPLGLNRLLNYLETGGEGSNVRPWVWILVLFLGPFTVQVAMQQYRWVGTRTVVRVESLLTQLVFEHALRIRMKAEVPEKGSGTSTAATSKAPSISEAAIQLSAAATADGGSPIAGIAAADLSEAASEGSTAGHTAAPSEATTVVQAQGDTASTAGKTKKDKDAKGDETEKKNLVGRINNLVTSDLTQIGGAQDFWLVVAYAPLEIVLDIILLYNILGWSAFVGLAIMLVMMPIPAQFTKLFHGVQKAKMKSTDARVELVTESLNIIRMIKLFAWEGRVSKRISDLREEELKHIWRRRMAMLAQDIVMNVIPIFHMICTFAVYALGQKKELTASVVFSSIAVFELLRDQFGNCMYLIPNIVQAKVSLDRINEFLVDTELLDIFTPGSNEDEALINAAVEEHTMDIGFGGAAFTWNNTVSGTATPSRAEFRLQIDEDLVFRKGKVNLVVGPTACGKTSMLMALLGEMHFIPAGPGGWFNLPREGGVAYAAQESWVQNETIRDNILFGAPYDATRYKKVVHQCALERDLELFEAGDQTEVGEKGLTLSGGQKARLTLARAVYSNAEILLLDDILAALDVHTAKWIVDNCLRGDVISGRTVILVTHNVALTSPLASFVVTLDTGGRIKSRGSVEDALAQDSTFRKIAEEQISAEKETVDDEENTKKPDAPVAGKLIIEEEVELGRVDRTTLLLYVKAMGGRWPILFWIGLVGGLLLSEAARSGQIWWLGNWANAYIGRPASEVSVGYYLGINVVIICTGVLFFCWGTYQQAEGSVRASREVHQRLLKSLLNTPLRWLDQTPVSRIITRCTQDIDAVDSQLASAFNFLVEMSAVLFVKLVAIFLFTPVFVIPGLVAAAAGAYVVHLYLRAQLPTKREMSKAKSPVLAHFGAAIAGITSIRAYGAQERFRSKQIENIDKYARTSSAYWNCSLWLRVRISLLGNLFSAGLASYLVYAPTSDVNPSTVGFSLNMSIAFSIMILWWIRVLNELEVQGNSLERINQYLKIEQEPAPLKEKIPPAYWPASGELSVEKLSARYSPDGPTVLKEISFHIRSGERIGIVGRTGSGKSSLTLSLLRCILTSGEVYYDGIPTSSLNLDALRSNITIIPQVPELLSGSLRHNLDPFNLYEDAALNDVLRSSGLNSIQKAEDDVRLTLDSQIASGGGNLSVGQRQIIALARAMLRKTKVLILDEATSAIDYETDAIIQSSLRNEFKDVTLLTIAHRLSTIMDADRIMVMDAGQIAEFASPAELLKNREGLLWRLVHESSDRDILLQMAGVKDKS